MSETIDEEFARREAERRHSKAARLCELTALQAAADKFYGLVNAHATDPEVAATASELLVIAAGQRKRAADLEHEHERLRGKGR